jgi:DNA-binding transcriptional ArsR family regulator
MKRWTLIFKALSNINRLKIIKLLAGSRGLNVTEIADSLKISLNATSKHLIMLNNLEVLENSGKHGHVFYRLNQDLPRDLRRAINLFI